MDRGGVDVDPERAAGDDVFEEGPCQLPGKPESVQFRLPGVPDVWVVGDTAAFSPDGGAPLPMVAPVAMQMGRQVARNITALATGKLMEPFRYFDKGQMATIGRPVAFRASFIAAVVAVEPSLVNFTMSAVGTVSRNSRAARTSISAEREPNGLKSRKAR